ncbi:MAG: GNAT family N-acetyltransferase [Clostridia bacterium]|nr:GNAT family N-acetyltransferase [Clostridia bacterium]
MTDYRFARSDEEEEILDLINAVFSQKARPHDFTRLIPKVYAHPGFSRFHAVAEVDGRIRGTVAMLPIDVQMGQDGNTLRGGYIGSVAVHPRFEKQGLMRALMAMQAEHARQTGLDFMALGGQRQRYNYHGFEKADLGLQFSVNAANVRHALKDVTPAELAPLSGPDDPALDALYDLYAAQPARCLRSRELFYDTLRTYNSAAWAVRDQKGNLVGYLVAMDNEITELVLRDEALLPQVIRAWMENRPRCAVKCPGWHLERAAALNAFAEGCEVSGHQMLRVLNWELTLNAALSFRHAIVPLPEGRRVIRVEGTGTWALEVTANQTRVSPTDDAPMLSLSEKQATALFFSPLSMLTVRDPLLRCWLPLPLDIPTADQF